MPKRPLGPILLAEDHADSREAFTALLQLEGYRVIAVEDGVAALEYLRTGERPCAVVLDLVMPRLDGWQLIVALRALPGGGDIPVFVLTGTNIATEDTAAELGIPAGHCFLKPCDPAAVVEALERHCHAHDARRAS